MKNTELQRTPVVARDTSAHTVKRPLLRIL